MSTPRAAFLRFIGPMPNGPFGDTAVLVFLVVQCLDGALTYLGLHIWGPAIEGNPIVASAVSVAGAGTGLFAMKLIASGLGILLHIQRVHRAVAVLAAFYLVTAVIPWTLLILAS